MQRNARKDSNHIEIANEFKKRGFVVLDLSQLKNCCDIAVSKFGITVMVEIKDGEKVPSKRKLTPGEEKFAKDWKREGHWQLIESIEDVSKLHSKILDSAEWRLEL